MPTAPRVSLHVDIVDRDTKPRGVVIFGDTGAEVASVDITTPAGELVMQLVFEALTLYVQMQGGRVTEVPPPSAQN